MACELNCCFAFLGVPLHLVSFGTGPVSSSTGALVACLNLSTALLPFFEMAIPALMGLPGGWLYVPSWDLILT